MTRLSDILTKKERILDLIEQFGFDRQARIYCGPEPLKEEKVFTLTLIIKYKDSGPSVSPENASLLRVKLLNELGCDVKISTPGSVPKPQWPIVDKRSDTMDNSENLCALLGVTNPEEVSLASTEKADEVLLKRADRYLSRTEVKAQPAYMSHSPRVESEMNSEGKRSRSGSGTDESNSPGETESPFKHAAHPRSSSPPRAK